MPWEVACGAEGKGAQRDLRLRSSGFLAESGSRAEASTGGGGEEVGGQVEVVVAAEQAPVPSHLDRWHTGEGIGGQNGELHVK